MEFTNEMIEKAKTAKTAEELLALAKAENVDLSAEQAAKYFAELNKTGELSDEELDSVAGGCGYKSGNKPKYFVGQWVYYERAAGLVLEVLPKQDGVFYYKMDFPKYPHLSGIQSEENLYWYPCD